MGCDGSWSGELLARPRLPNSWCCSMCSKKRTTLDCGDLQRAVHGCAWRVSTRLILFPKASIDTHGACYLQSSNSNMLCMCPLSCFWEVFAQQPFFVGVVGTVGFRVPKTPEQARPRSPDFCQKRLLKSVSKVKSIENLTTPESSLEMQFQISTV